jgi:hypothetical protein
LLLRHSNHPTAVADTFADMGVYRMLHTSLQITVVGPLA